MMATYCLGYLITVLLIMSLYYSIHMDQKRNQNADVHGEPISGAGLGDVPQWGPRAKPVVGGQGGTPMA